MTLSNWTPDEDVIAREMAAAGATRWDIAFRLNRSDSSVKTRLKTLGVSLKNLDWCKITAENVGRYVTYDPINGVLATTGLRTHSSARLIWEGDEAVYVRICGKNRRAAHVAFLIMKGRWPEEIAYDDKDFRNLRWSNLIEVTRSQQCARHGLNSNNTSGFKGASWSRLHRKWVAMITHNRRQMYLGLYDSAELAHDAYCAAGVRLFGPHFNPGPTAKRVNPPQRWSSP